MIILANSYLKQTLFQFLNYRKALSINPRHANTLYNFGVMLDTHCNRKLEADEFYCKVLDEEPQHSYALYNLAVLLEERLNSMEVGTLKSVTTLAGEC